MHLIVCAAGAFKYLLFSPFQPRGSLLDLTQNTYKKLMWFHTHSNSFFTKDIFIYTLTHKWKKKFLKLLILALAPLSIGWEVLEQFDLKMSDHAPVKSSPVAPEFPYVALV